jgi:hypothetical protein
MQEFSGATGSSPVVAVERRRIQDRRGIWRGGRRNTDWMSRPVGGWARLEQTVSPWRQWFAKLPLHISFGTHPGRESRP